MHITFQSKLTILATIAIGLALPTDIQPSKKSLQKSITETATVIDDATQTDFPYSDDIDSTKSYDDFTDYSEYYDYYPEITASYDDYSDITASYDDYLGATTLYDYEDLDDNDGEFYGGTDTESYVDYETLEGFYATYSYDEDYETETFAGAIATDTGSYDDY